MSTIIGRPLILAGGGGTSAPAIFGDGSDGAGLFSTDTTWDAPTEDTGMIEKNFESLIISEGVTVSAGNRNCGMIVRVKGDCTINGTLANLLAPKTLLDSDNVDFSGWPLSMLSGTAGDGGDGGGGGDGSTTGGAGQTGRFYGGGYSGGGGGGYYGTTVGGNGGSSANITTGVTEIFVGGRTRYEGTYWDGQYGGGGAGRYSGNTLISGGSGAGASGTANYVGSGGAGNYGGGVIILLVGGNLTISGTINCSGNTGGAGGNMQESYTTKNGGSGGGGGGGRIFICYRKKIANNGTLNVAGGTGGTVGFDATAGSSGTDGTTTIKTYEEYLKEDVA